MTGCVPSKLRRRGWTHNNSIVGYTLLYSAMVFMGWPFFHTAKPTGLI